MVVKVVVIGGGNAGAIVTNKLKKYKDISVKVIEPSEYHYYQPSTIDIAVGIEEENKFVKSNLELLGDAWIKASAKKVDVENHQVILDNENRIDYDYLVIAAGVKNKKIEGFPSWHTLEGAKELRAQISNFSGKRIVVGYFGTIKCPAAPFELSYLLKEKYPNAEITLVNPVSQPPEIQRPMAEILGKRAKQLGINVIRGFKIKNIDNKNKIIESENGEKIAYDLALIDTPIYAGDEFSNLRDEKSNLIPVDKETLEYRDYDNVFAIGDITNILVPPKTGALAHFEANYIVKSIINSITTNEKLKFNGDAMCAVYNGFGKGSFIYMNYNKSSALGPSSIFFKAKQIFGNIYWQILLGKIF
ncbi:NAD(P)/FAD-dependent oxidoreductase [Acidianus sulfidivorans JP7]|uniref:Pyridine nucleotide-disulfide oxidoreductase n=1 Tax=Acidianus sulfidivorans JP7 TaxID=619593 RepID=A0A2U9IK93_9CREN|nr:FAD/NAD(P)-binding oxidoreductase [Acidianus sulfidivorans]AWR96457.1 NAD(P)/FAD-dependent oxidoreductase [Acidianus sulfidivorans JP7]